MKTELTKPEKKILIELVASQILELSNALRKHPYAKDAKTVVSRIESLKAIGNKLHGQIREQK